MPPKIIPVVDGKETTWAALQVMMGGVTRQQAQAKYKKLKELGPVTLQALTTRYQSPQVAQRKAANQNEYTRQQMVNHARTHGPTHTSMVYGVSRDEIVAMVNDSNRAIKDFYAGKR